MRTAFGRAVVAGWLSSALLVSGAEFAHGQEAARAQSPGFRLPQVGTTLPTVTVYDDQGREFSTASLRGQYTVLVFGCLT